MYSNFFNNSPNLNVRFKILIIILVQVYSVHLSQCSFVLIFEDVFLLVQYSLDVHLGMI